jgi:hypothetical protein
MATLTPTSAARTGVDLAGAAAAGGGDQWLNTGKELLTVKNGSGSSINVTLDIQSTVDGAAVTDPVVAVGAGVTKLIGPFPTNIYNDGNGMAKVSYSSATSVTVKVVRVDD